jgi:hypothetical protein
MGDWKIVSRGTGLFWQEHGLPKQNMLLLMDQCTAHNNDDITLKSICLLYPLADTTLCCMKQAYWRHVVHFRLWEIDRNIYTEDKKMECHGSYMRCFHGVEIHYACCNWELCCETWLQHCRFSQCQQLWWRRISGTTRLYWLPQYFWWVS